ncbi:hypothetical protein ADILRU_1031 [Leifsonia rubra CMS 76R]|nr:hypothetical protein ADILRU_1031 [Leifsonia rubra CMS 76R]
MNLRNLFEKWALFPAGLVLAERERVLSHKGSTLVVVGGSLLYVRY